MSALENQFNKRKANGTTKETATQAFAKLPLKPLKSTKNPEKQSSGSFVKPYPFN